MSSSCPLSFSRPSKALPMKAGLVVPGAGTSLTGAKHSILLSPSAFQHSVAKTTELQRKASPPPTATGGVELPQPSYNRIQLQDTLIHLIKVERESLFTPDPSLGFEVFVKFTVLYCRLQLAVVDIYKMLMNWL